MKKPQIDCICDACGSRFKVGAGCYGKRLKGYDLYVCQPCYDNNYDGWSPYNEQFIMIALKRDGRELPDRMLSGFLPREF